MEFDKPNNNTFTYPSAVSEAAGQLQSQQK
jgi:hypothetical protein